MRAASALNRLAPSAGTLARVLHRGAAVWAVEEDGRLSGLAGEDLGLSAAATFLPPVTGSKIVGLGYNYRSLMAEQRQEAPLLFLKAPNALALDGSPILMAREDRVWIEVELGIVLAEGGRQLSVSQARRSILGWVVANDVTAADPSGRDHHLAVSKSRDGFCPVSARLWRGRDVSDAVVEARINGRLVQSSRTSDRFLSDAEAVSFASRHITLGPGDLLLTGTPAGAQQALVRPGDSADVRIEGLGSVRSTFVEEGL